MKLIEITSKKTYSYSGNVYDLEVEDNHSYNVNGVIVHNSDYVMLGSLLNKTMQSAGFNYLYGIKIPYDMAKTLWKWGFPVKKKYRGMSTKSVQRNWGRVKLKTAEGITKYQKIEYNLPSWVENFEDYLKSSMSYCGAKNLEHFIGYAEWIFITENAFRRFHK